jgi:exosortase
MYVPVYMDLAATCWKAGRSIQGPVILALIAWLIWRARAALAEPPQRRAPRSAIALFGVGLLGYFLGRSQSFLQLELFAQVPLLLGLIWTLWGATALQRLAFPIAFSLFLMPVPGTLLDGVLLPLKQLVSMLADASLHAAGYPIARNGVMLMIGPYDLLVADACSGLNSMIALTGVGLIYAYVVDGRLSWHSAVVLASVLPIAFTVNVVRVILLLLSTYYAGDDAGRTFHSWAAYLEMACAFAALFAVDRLTTRVLARAAA